MPLELTVFPVVGFMKFYLFAVLREKTQAVEKR